jgi:hypothetical protein
MTLAILYLSVAWVGGSDSADSFDASIQRKSNERTERKAQHKLDVVNLEKQLGVGFLYYEDPTHLRTGTHYIDADNKVQRRLTNNIDADIAQRRVVDEQGKLVIANYLLIDKTNCMLDKVINADKIQSLCPEGTCDRDDFGHLRENTGNKNLVVANYYDKKEWVVDYAGGKKSEFYTDANDFGHLRTKKTSFRRQIASKSQL